MSISSLVLARQIDTDNIVFYFHLSCPFYKTSAMLRNFVTYVRSPSYLVLTCSARDD